MSPPVLIRLTDKLVVSSSRIARASYRDDIVHLEFIDGCSTMVRDDFGYLWKTIIQACES